MHTIALKLQAIRLPVAHTKGQLTLLSGQLLPASARSVYRPCSKLFLQSGGGGFAV